MKGVRCPACGARATRLLDSRDITGGRRRRRECSPCGHRFSTVEQVAVMKRGLHAGNRRDEAGRKTFEIANADRPV